MPRDASIILETFRGSHKKHDQDWSELLALRVDAIRPLRGIRVPTAVQARSACRAHGVRSSHRAWSKSVVSGRVSGVSGPPRRAAELPTIHSYINPCLFLRSYKLFREIPNDSAVRWMSPSRVSSVCLMYSFSTSASERRFGMANPPLVDDWPLPLGASTAVSGGR